MIFVVLHSTDLDFSAHILGKENECLSKGGAFFAYCSEGQVDGYERFGEVKRDTVLRKGGFCQRERV